MKQNSYKISITQIADKTGKEMDGPSLTFISKNHDDVFNIVELIRSRGLFSSDDAASFAVGLKMFSEIMLQNKEHYLFKDFAPHFKDFMATLKHKPNSENN